MSGHPVFATISQLHTGPSGKRICCQKCCSCEGSAINLIFARAHACAVVAFSLGKPTIVPRDAALETTATSHHVDFSLRFPFILPQRPNTTPRSSRIRLDEIDALVSILLTFLFRHSNEEGGHCSRSKAHASGLIAHV